MDSNEADEERHKSASGTLLGVFRHGSDYPANLINISFGYIISLGKTIGSSQFFNPSSR
jgi:hypothetical protein